MFICLAKLYLYLSNKVNAYFYQPTTSDEISIIMEEVEYSSD